MNNKTECDIVKDLAIPYTENLINDGSKKFVEEHLKKCDECKKYYENLEEKTFKEKILEKNNDKMAFRKLKVINKNRKVNLIIGITIVIIIILWGSGIIPKQIARIYTTNYLKNNFPKVQLEYVGIEWSDAFGDYIIQFEENNGKTYGFVIGPKYFPVNLGQGFVGFMNEYMDKYETDHSRDVPLIELKVKNKFAGGKIDSYILSQEESRFLTKLVENMKCRNYTCDGIANYKCKIGESEYGVELYKTEAHIIPYSDNIENEAVIVGDDFIKLKNLLDKYVIHIIGEDNVENKENIKNVEDLRNIELLN